MLKELWMLIKIAAVGSVFLAVITGIALQIVVNTFPQTGDFIDPLNAPISFAVGGAFIFYWVVQMVLTVVWYIRAPFGDVMERINHIDTITAPPKPSTRTAIPSHVKRAVYLRDGGQCQHCYSGVNLEYDHKIPWSKGGGNNVNNIQLLCRKCNRRKGNRHSY